MYLETIIKKALISKKHERKWKNIKCDFLLKLISHRFRCLKKKILIFQNWKYTHPIVF